MNSRWLTAGPVGWLRQGLRPLWAINALLGCFTIAIAVWTIAQMVNAPKVQVPGNSQDVMAPIAPPVYTALPLESQYMEQSRLLYNRFNGLNIKVLDMKFESRTKTEGNLVTHQVLMRVEGTYPLIKQFLADMVGSNDNIALLGWGLARQQGKGQALTAEVRLAMHYHLTAPEAGIAPVFGQPKFRQVSATPVSPATPASPASAAPGGKP